MKVLKVWIVDCVIKKRRFGNVFVFKDEFVVWVWKFMEFYILDELKDLLRLDMVVFVDNIRGKDGFEVFDEVLELKVIDEMDLDIEGSDMGVGVGVFVKVGM